MPKLSIDGRNVEVEPGATILDAARKLGVDVPTLCHLEGLTPATSCLVCVVKLDGRLLPACATRAEEGMSVESESDAVRDARRTALELLLSDHLGDCRSPCQRICPLDLDVPLMLRQVQRGELEQAIVDVRAALPLPAVSGRICPANCESGCRRGVHDEAASIRAIEGHVADVDLASPEPHVPPCEPSTGRRVAVVGAGPTGLSCAHFLLRAGHACTLFEARESAGGSLREIAHAELPPEVLDAELGVLGKMGAELQLGTRVGDEITLEDLRRDFDAVLLAVGAQGAGETWGLGSDGKGIRADGRTCETDTRGVFAAGDAVRAQGRPVRSMAEGKKAAAAIGQYLAGVAVTGLETPFSSTVGRLREGEIEEYLKGASPVPSVIVKGRRQLPIVTEDATRESERCLHCDCRKAPTCALRRYGEQYGAEAARYKGERRRFRQLLGHPFVVFEPGKCIVCGICVQIAEGAREDLGLTYVGRGFDVRVAVPFDRGLDEGLRKVARDVVAACPTGALAARDDGGLPEEP